MGKRDEEKDNSGEERKKGTAPSGYAMHDATGPEAPTEGHEPSGYATYE